MTNFFKINVIKQNWIKNNGLYDKYDLCSHGTVFVKIGDEVISTPDSGNWTLTCTALLLMRSAFRDHVAGEMENKLLPCCGHFMYPDENGDILVTGCPSGIDWSVTHQGHYVAVTTEMKTVTIGSIEEYKLIVLDFVNEVEKFYGNPEDKVLPNDDFTCEGFKLFWKNWGELKSRL